MRQTRLARAPAPTVSNRARAPEVKSVGAHEVRDAMDEGRSTVVVHALSGEQQKAAAEFLSSRGGEVTRTL